MSRRTLTILALGVALLAACGRVGPPVRPQPRVQAPAEEPAPEPASEIEVIMPEEEEEQP